MTAASSFVAQEYVRCEDCDLRGDLHADGHPLPEAKSHIMACAGCGGTGHVPAPSPVDPYAAPVDPADAYAARRAARAELRSVARLPRADRRRYLDHIRIESLMEAL